MAVGSRKIVDAHFHLWDLGENYYPWLADRDRPTLVKNAHLLRRNYLISDFFEDFDDLNVIAGVHIQAEHDHTDVVRETCWLQNVADSPNSRGFPQAIVADADFGAADIEYVLERHSVFANLRGIRHALHRTLDAPVSYDPLQNPAWHRNFPLLLRYNLSFDMQLFPRQSENACRLIAANPDIQIVLDHAAMPIRGDVEGLAQWRDSLWRYAQYPNVAIKLSGFATFVAHWTSVGIEPIITQVIDAFEPERCMLASNYPVEGLSKPYREIWETYADCLSAYSQAEQEAMFWRNAARIYRIQLPGITT